MFSASRNLHSYLPWHRVDIEPKAARSHGELNCCQRLIKTLEDSCTEEHELYWLAVVEKNGHFNGPILCRIRCALWCHQGQWFLAQPGAGSALWEPAPQTCGRLCKAPVFIENPEVCVTGCKQRAKFAISMECMWIFDLVKPPSLHAG